MEDFLRFTNLITAGNIIGLGTVITTAFVLYWKLKTKWYDLQQEYLQHIRDLTQVQTTLLQASTDAQTAHIEECIHKLPEHPENPTATN